jgi:dihydropteroate synthase
MRRTGATEPGLARMMTKAEALALAMEHLSRRQANLLKQEMLAAGGDAAVHHGVCSEAVDETRVVLVGTRRQFTALEARLAEEPLDLPAVGEVIRRALEAYARRRFEIPMGPHRLAVGPKPALMGIVNVTPDSFSRDGLAGDPEAAVALGLRMAEAGADILDVGGESTRPGSDPVSEDEERRRVLPVVEALARRVRTPISIDTRRARVAREALAAGACVVNDVTALRGDPAMAATVAKSGAGLVLMHMQGEPKTMQDRPVYDNLMADIGRFLRQSMALAAEAGVPEEKILVDPGIGFGKTLADNLQVLARLGQLRTLGRPILVGPSRKRFIGDVTGVRTPAERTYGTAAACALAVAAGALVLRVHDVPEMRQALAVAGAMTEAGETIA